MSGASAYGKGDRTRQRSVPWEVYDLNYDIQAGNITRTEYDARIEAAWARARKRGWRASI